MAGFSICVRSSRPEVFCKKGVFRNFTKSTWKPMHQSLFFNKVALLKKRLWHRCFPVNYVKFPRTTFFIEHLWWLLLLNELIIIENGEPLQVIRWVALLRFSQNQSIRTQLVRCFLRHCFHRKHLRLLLLVSLIQSMIQTLKKLYSS